MLTEDTLSIEKKKKNKHMLYFNSSKQSQFNKNQPKKA